MLNDAKHDEISRKMDMIIKILAGIMLKDSALGDKISVLKELGFERKEIAELSGTTPATVTTYLYQQKKKGKKWREAKKEEHNEPGGVELTLVLGYIAVKEEETIEKKVGVLAQLGYPNRDIAAICGTNENVIRAAKSRFRVTEKKKK